MKAHKGDEIVCGCPQPAGSFLRDVHDHASISPTISQFHCRGAALKLGAMSAQRATRQWPSVSLATTGG